MRKAIKCVLCSNGVEDCGIDAHTLVKPDDANGGYTPSKKFSVCTSCNNKMHNEKDSDTIEKFRVILTNATKEAIKCVICLNVIDEIDPGLPKLSKTNEETGEVVSVKELDVCKSCGDKIRAEGRSVEKDKFFTLLFSAIEQDTKNDIDKQDSINN